MSEQEQTRDFEGWSAEYELWRRGLDSTALHMLGQAEHWKRTSGYTRLDIEREFAAQRMFEVFAGVDARVSHTMHDLLVAALEAKEEIIALRKRIAELEGKIAN